MSDSDKLHILGEGVAQLDALDHPIVDPARKIGFMSLGGKHFPEKFTSFLARKKWIKI